MRTRHALTNIYILPMVDVNLISSRTSSSVMQTAADRENGKKTRRMKVIMNPCLQKGVVICQSSCKTRASNASLLNRLPVRVCTVCVCFTVCSAAWVQHGWDNTYEFLMHTPIHIPCVTNISSASFSHFRTSSRELAPTLQTSFNPTV